jgi:hypothetical protein
MRRNTPFGRQIGRTPSVGKKPARAESRLTLRRRRGFQGRQRARGGRAAAPSREPERHGRDAREGRLRHGGAGDGRVDRRVGGLQPDQGARLQARARGRGHARESPEGAAARPEHVFRFNRRLIAERVGLTYDGINGVAKGRKAWRHPTV